MTRLPVVRTLAFFRFDGKRIPFRDGDTVGSALHRGGVLEIARSMKYHRARGLYCGQGSCGSCLVEVDGVPNTPACMAKATAGATVRSQNRIGSAKRDLLAITDKVFRQGFDPHGAFTKPRLLNRAFMLAVRFMSGQGKAPTDAVPRPTRRHRHEVKELIIGAGEQGLRRAHAIGGPALILDEAEALGGQGAWDASDPGHGLAAELPPHVDAWTGALAFGIYGDVVAIRRGDELHEVRAKTITLATGQHDAWPVFGNNDLPGILSHGAASRLLHAHGVMPGTRVVGHPRLRPDLRRALEASGATVVAEGQVDAADGGTRVKAARIGVVWIACNTIICDLPGTPRIELAQQAGCSLGVQEGVLTVDHAEGQTSRADIRWEGR